MENNFNQVCPNGNTMVDGFQEIDPPCGYCCKCEWCLENLPEYDDQEEDE